MSGVTRWRSGGEGGTYVNPATVPNTIGGIASGTNFASEKTMQEMWDLLLYPFSNNISVSPSVAEMGQVLTTLTFTWSAFAGAVNTIGGGIGLVTTSPKVATGLNISTNTTFSLTSVKGSTTRTANTTVSFLNGIYMGVTPATVTPTDVEILASSKTLTGNKTQSKTYDCSGGRRYFIAYPSRLGSLNAIKVNNLPNNSFNITTTPITNAYGFTENYTVYTSLNLVFGASIPVAWA